MGSFAAAAWAEPHAAAPAARESTTRARAIGITAATLALGRRDRHGRPVLEALVELRLEPAGGWWQARPAHDRRPLARPVHPAVAHAQPHEQGASADVLEWHAAALSAEPHARV